MTLTEAQSALGRVLAYGQGQVIVSAGDLNGRLRHWIKPAAAAKVAEAKAEAAVTAKANSFHSRPGLSTPYQAPRNPTEQTLVNIWQTILGIEPIGVQDNFFELGGDSLLVAQVLNQIQRTLQQELPLSVLFEQPTIAQIAERLRARPVAPPPSAPAALLAEDEEEGEI
jgi:acyl carrier protein